MYYLPIRANSEAVLSVTLSDIHGIEVVEVGSRRHHTNIDVEVVVVVAGKAGLLSKVSAS